MERDEKEQWINDVLGMPIHHQAAPAHLFEKIDAAVQYKRATIVPLRITLAAAAGIALLVGANILTFTKAGRQEKNIQNTQLARTYNNEDNTMLYDL